MKKNLFLFIILLFALNLTYAQSTWKWAKRGGSTVSSTGFGPSEDIEDITTDKWGNVYLISNVYNSGINIDGHIFPSTGATTAEQICIASYKCDGTFRWYKMVFATQNQAIAIKTDTLGGVYIAGQIAVIGGSSPNFCVIGDSARTDTSFGPTRKSMFLMKVDTGGAYKWFMMPEPDTLTAFSMVSTIYDMDVDGSGNCHLFCSLKPGAYAGGAFVATDSPIYNFAFQEPAYILKFNSSGVFQSGFHLPYWQHSGNYGAPVVYMKRDFERHRYYVTGGGATIAGDSMYVAGNFILIMYVACFDDAGSLLWIKLGTAGPPSDRPALDNNGYVYITGSALDSNTFNGSMFTGMGLYASVPFVAKMDSNGNNVWAVNGSGPSDLAWGTGIAVANNRVGIFGAYSSPYLAWGGDTLPSAVYTPFMAELNATSGNLITLTALNATNAMPGDGGSFGRGTTGTLAADQYGNFYGGGNFATQIIIPGDTVTSVGGESDWFIVKYGTSNCTVPLELTNTTSKNECSVYPNPNSGSFIIQRSNIASSAIFRLRDITGREVFTTPLLGTSGNSEITLPNLSNDMYFYELYGEDNSRVNGKILILK